MLTVVFLHVAVQARLVPGGEAAGGAEQRHVTAVTPHVLHQVGFGGKALGTLGAGEVVLN